MRRDVNMQILFTSLGDRSSGGKLLKSNKFLGKYILTNFNSYLEKNGGPKPIF